MTATQPLRIQHGNQKHSDYGSLIVEARAAGLLDRSVVGYLPRIATLVVLVASGSAALFYFGNSLWQLAVAAYSGVVLAQLGFLGHDAGHQQISRSRRCNVAFGTVLAALGVGLSYGWWVDKHNRHHRHPNQMGRDPDVAPGVVSWTSQQAEQQRGPFRIIARHQAGLFFPLLMLEGWNLHIASVIALSRKGRRNPVEIALLVIHVAAGLTVLLLVLSPLRVLEFVAIQQSVLGIYIGASFAPNHKGMPLIATESKLGFVERQVMTSRNVSGGRFVAVMFGGLNYQIEHHLFPSMPSRNLGRCQPIVRAFCAAHSLPYTQTSMRRSYSLSLGHLHRVQPSSRRRRQTLAKVLAEDQVTQATTARSK